VPPREFMDLRSGTFDLDLASQRHVRERLRAAAPAALTATSRLAP
jgi:hypothetical protein